MGPPAVAMARLLDDVLQVPVVPLRLHLRPVLLVAELNAERG